MYNPSRGGVRGGADQFTWEGVKTDKHRENYLGHSLKAPVGRWQKGKDLSWYARGRKDDDETLKIERSEMAAIKQAEEEAMLIALGHKTAKKEFQSHALTKEEMTEVLKRNTGERDELNIERVDGVGATSHRAAMLSGISKDSRTNNEGMVFVTQKEKDAADPREIQSSKRPKTKKKSSKKEKKHKRSITSSDSESQINLKKKHKKHKKEHDSELQALSRSKHKKKSYHKYQNYSDLERDSRKRDKKITYERHQKSVHQRKRHDTSDSD